MRPAGEKPRSARLLEGGLEFSRPVYECPRCRRSHAPLDAELGLGAHEQLGRLVRKKAAYAAAHGSFAGASRDLKHQAEIDVSPAEIARVAEQAGAALAERQDERDERWREPVSGDHVVAEPEIACERLVFESDATAVLTVEGEENKMVYVATAFDASARGEKTPGGRPFIAERRFAACAGDFEDFGPEMRALAHRMGARGAKKIAFLADGAPCLWKWAEENLPGAVMIQDPWHVFDRQSKLLDDLGETGDAKRARLDGWKETILAGRVGEVIEQLRGMKKGRRKDKKRKRIEEEIGYLEKGRPRMDYPRYREDGWPIGSGAIEATCKHLVKERFNLTGARWKRGRLKYVLALRLSIFNEEWESDWTSAALRSAA
jgi:hypothetical protein